MTTPSSSLTRRDRSDLWATLIVAAVAGASVITLAVRRLLAMFAEAGATTVDMPAQASGVAFPVAEGADVTGTITRATVAVPDLPAIVIGSFVLDIVVTAAGYLAVIVLAVILCVRFMRGRFFERGASRLLATISIVLVATPIAGVFFRNMGLNGTYAALGGDFDGMSELFWEAAPVYLAAMAVGALAIAFRQGERLRRETEGLV
jgi:hypothetical protein